MYICTESKRSNSETSASTRFNCHHRASNMRTGARSTDQYFDHWKNRQKVASLVDAEISTVRVDVCMRRFNSGQWEGGLVKSNIRSLWFAQQSCLYMHVITHISNRSSWHVLRTQQQECSFLRSSAYACMDCMHIPLRGGHALRVYVVIMPQRRTVHVHSTPSYHIPTVHTYQTILIHIL